MYILNTHTYMYIVYSYLGTCIRMYTYLMFEYIYYVNRYLYIPDYIHIYKTRHNGYAWCLSL